MPIATGSLAFLGAARFQGYWNASTNAASGSGLDGSKFLPHAPSIDALFKSGSSSGGGYYNELKLDVSGAIGDYWQVTGSGTHDVEGQTDWDLNDWIIYSGSLGGTTKWTKLAYEDTLASIVIGDISGANVFHLSGSNDKRVLFISGTSDADVRQSGSANFTYDYTTDTLHLSTASFAHNTDSTGNQILIADNVTNALKVAEGTNNYISFCTTNSSERIVVEKDIRVMDDTKLVFGNNADASIEYDEDGTNTLLYAGASLRISDDVKLEFGDAGDASFEYDENSTDTLKYAGASMRISDDVKVEFGDAGESYIQYRESDDNYLVISGSSSQPLGGLVLSGSKITFEPAADQRTWNNGDLAVQGSLQLYGNIIYGSGGRILMYDPGTTGSIIFPSGSTTFISNITASSPARFKHRVDFEEVLGTDTIVRIHSSSDDGIIDVYANNEVTTRINGNGYSYFNGGNVGIGTSSPVYTLSVSGSTQAWVSIESSNDNRLYMSSHDTPSNGNAYGTIFFAGHDGSGLETAASIKVEADGTPGNNDMPGRIVFSTTPDGSNSVAERMKIRQDGKIELLGSTHLPDDTKLNFGDGDDAYIEFDDAGSKNLVISGSGTGIALQGSLITASCQQLDIVNPIDGGSAVLKLVADRHDEGDITDAFTISKANGGLATLASSNILIDSAAIIRLDAGSGAYKIDLYGNGAERGYFLLDAADTVKINDSSDTELVHFTTNVVEVQDNIKLQFGDDNDAHIEYNADGDGKLVISGSVGGGIVMSGSALHLISGRTAATEEHTGNLKPGHGDIIISGSDDLRFIADDMTFSWGSNNGDGGVSTVGADRLQFKETSAKGAYAVWHEEVYVEHSGAIRYDNHAYFNDDKKLYFGSNQDAYVEFKSSGAGGGSALVLSASVNGISLSGSRINIPTNQSMHFGDSGIGAYRGKIRYDSATEFLIISGSAMGNLGGLVLSGASIIVDNDLLPNADNVYDLGSASKRWANAHMGDLHLRNERGSWTIVEEADYLSIRNNKTNKLYKFVLEEIEE